MLPDTKCFRAQVTLINVTLQTLQRFLAWIPPNFVFETRLLETLVTKFFCVEAFRNSTLRCLAEVVSMPACPPKYEPTLLQFFVAFVEQLKRTVPNHQQLPAMYEQSGWVLLRPFAEFYLT
jgi:exportin-1